MGEPVFRAHGAKQPENPAVYCGKMKKAFLVFFVLLPILAAAQSTNAPLNEDYYHRIDRYEIKAGRILPELFTSVKPYRRVAIVSFVDSLELKDGVFTSQQDRFNYDYLRNDSWEWSLAVSSDNSKPVLKHLYRKKSDLYQVDIPEFDLHVNPVLYLSGGADSERSGMTYINTRGVEIRGMVDRKVGFYTFIGENQSVLPMYVQQMLSQNPVIPHEGLWKPFKTNAVDFFQARAYIDFSISKHINMQFGHDRMFIGNGYRSLIYSDHAAPQLYWRTNVKVWRLNYLFQINRMVADVSGNSGGLINGKYPEKYVAFHHASLNIGKRLNVGFFESIIFSPQDSLANGGQKSFELNYLNPVIFYRAIEQQSGSADNAILGVDVKWNLAKGISLYGQFVLDEFLLKHIRARDGWWANKYALQTGLKYIDVAGVSNLDVQLEGNIVRPYTYSHNTLYGSYSNYRQPIAHPLGANFKELVAIVRYQPLSRLSLTGKMIYAKRGLDLPGENFGGDVLKSNLTHAMEFGNTIGQGHLSKLMFVEISASWMLMHNMFLDVKHIVRQTKTDDAGVLTSGNDVNTRNTSITSLALRWNIAARNYDF